MTNKLKIAFAYYCFCLGAALVWLIEPRLDAMQKTALIIADAFIFCADLAFL